MAFADLAGLFFALWPFGVWTAHAAGDPPSSAPTALVELVPLKRQAMMRTVHLYGQVVVDMRAVTVISLPRAGQVERFQVVNGQRIRKGAPLGRFVTAADITAGYLQLEQTRDYARAELARNESLFSQQLLTQSQLAAARKALTDADAALQIAQATGSDRRDELLVAPFDAVVLATPVNAGERLSANAPIVQLARQDSQHALLGVADEDRGDIRPGLIARIHPVFGAQTAVSGRVSEVSGQINKDTQRLDVLVTLSGAPMPIGTHVRADVDLASRVEWVVPHSSVLHDDQGAYLFQAHQGRARRVSVIEGIEHAGQLAVRGALISEDAVVSLGNYELLDGMALREVRH